ncbi:metallophosphoesterase family protein [Brevundimonas naejangsanensis]|uniref:Metallophosphoesterase family protein n=1 Tax=Brevundimonas naejangsanensis TaxID=588932 RepID=A0A494RM34_9CAUL|nr:metallophosphoesterase family protein [Brevundimonas naejangsanensis]AYG94804.1 metallophosphoesterase family protein [Brevundimonas naejangsanensis]
MHLKTLLIAGAALVAGLPAIAHAQASAPTAPSVSAPRPWAPTGLPDRIVLTPGADAARDMAVAWRTDGRQVAALAELVEAIDGPAYEERAQVVAGRSTDGAALGGQGRHHAARFEGLKPATTYLYRVRGADGWSEWLSFRTAAADLSEPFRILYFGDTQNSILSKGSRTIRNGLLRTSPDVVVHAGDLTGRSHDWEWGEWTAAGGYGFAMIPQLPAAGNHEYSDDDEGARHLGPLWSAQFALPGNGADKAPETSYFVDYQGVRFIVLDGTAAAELDSLDSQTRWLDGALASSTARWNVVVQHQPIYTCARPDDTKALKAAWEPIYRARNVDMVLQGHDHCYSRITDGEGQAAGAARRAAGAPQGPVYVVSVAGPKMYGLNDRALIQPDRVAADTQLYQTIDVEAGRLRYRAYTVSGALYDAVDIVRAADGSKSLEAPSEALPSLRLCDGAVGPDGVPCVGSPK